MKTYHDDAQLKADMIREAAWHREQDMLVKGTYGKINGTFKGCAVGCAAHSLYRIKGEKGRKPKMDDHAAIGKSLGIPEWLMLLQDTLFEGLPDADSQQFPERFLRAIPVGVSDDTLRRQVQAPFIQFVLRECRDFALPDGKVAIDAVVSLWFREQRGDGPSAEDWSAAWSAARSAAWSAWSAWSARSAAESAESAARSAARSAAWSARSAARSAWSAAESAARSARSAAYIKFADELLRLLEACQ